MTTSLANHLEKIHESGKNDFRWNNLQNLIKKYINGTYILDAGCGTGHMTLKLLNEGYEVTAIDYSRELTDFTQRIIDQNNLKADIQSLNLLDVKTLGENKFTTALCLDVIEHIDNDELALKNLGSTIKNEGLLILSVPAFSFLYGLRDKEIGHYRRYNRKDLVKLIENSGLEIIDIRYWNFLGFLPFLISEKILHKKIGEEIRYSKKSHLTIALNGLLNKWFSIIENNIRFPVGLSLIAICKKNNETSIKI